MVADNYKFYLDQMCIGVMCLCVHYLWVIIINCELVVSGGKGELAVS